MTRGVWQKDLVPILARNGFIPYALDYGSFSAVKLLCKRARDRKVKWLRETLEGIPEFQLRKRLSIIAHSFGTYLVGQLLETYPMFKFDKVIFAGSIVDRNYNWDTKLTSRQVNWLRNDYGRLDPWPCVASKMISGAGNSGGVGFDGNYGLMEQIEYAHYKHSNYFHPTHFTDEWVPTLKRIVLNNGVVLDVKCQERLVQLMDYAVQVVSQRLGLDSEIVRANLFVQDEDGNLSIPPGLHHHMDNPFELTISIPIGMGCTGIAFEQRQYAIAVFQQNWGRYTLPDEELKKVDRRLQWVFSMPVHDTRSPGGQAPLGVLNVDGLYVRKDKDSLDSLNQDMLSWSQAVGKAMLG